MTTIGTVLVCAGGLLFGIGIMLSPMPAAIAFTGGTLVGIVLGISTAATEDEGDEEGADATATG